MNRPWRILIHALDRTGPPMLALALIRWLAQEHPAERVEVVSFRGGPLEAVIGAIVPVRVVLDDHEPWDVHAPNSDRVRVLRAHLAGLEPARANLLVSVAAAQLLPLMPTARGPIVTWAVEVGDDLHWLDDRVGLEHSDGWLAGSEATARELRQHPNAPDTVLVVPEFVSDPPTCAPAERDAAREALGARSGDLLVVGAGIGTWRKGLDLFVEVAVNYRRRFGDGAHFCWIGGEADPLYPLVAEELGRPGFDHISLRPPQADIERLLAAADVVLHPARRDAFPLVCVHAAAAGTPVVAFTDSGGVAELLGSDLRGGPFPDVERLETAIADLRDPVERLAVGAAHARRARGHVASHAAPIVMAAVRALADQAAP